MILCNRYLGDEWSPATNAQDKLATEVEWMLCRWQIKNFT